jgi:two-component system NtrC family response regulator
LVAHSVAFQHTLAQLERFARFDRALILLEGESGTGKTSLARYAHECSRRRDGVFHRVDLGALDDALAGSELFGHAVGAFTGAGSRRHGHFLSAEHGTLFLDEIGKASAAVQRRLLHVIDTGELTAVGMDRSIRVDVRLITATNASLEQLVARGEFLPDLLWRFGHFRIEVPPLRERRADIPKLALALVARHAPAFGYPEMAPELSEDLLTALQEAPWPGNVRELSSAIQFLLVIADCAPRITLRHCQGPLAGLASTESRGARVRRVIAEEKSVVRAARRLGVSRTTVYRHLEQDKASTGTD